MAKNKKRKQIKPNPKPKGVEYRFEDGMFKLYKVWTSKVTAKQPYYITDDLDEMVSEIADFKEKYRVNIDLQKLIRFTEQYK